jgi:hypothetical protein
MSSNLNAIDKRTAADRRKRKIPPVKYLLFGGNRTGTRRNDDKNELVFVDKYNPKLLLIVLGILILSLVDGFFTLYLTGHGANELNPIMDYFLNLSPWAFMIIKFFLTCSALICILILNNMYFKPFNIRVRSLFPVLFAVFLVVIFWQIYLKFSNIS